MSKILFPTDFSNAANNAFVYALEMAKLLEAELIVLHVYDLPIVSYEGYPSYVADVYQSIELSNFENFKDEIPLLRKMANEHHFDNVRMTHVLEQGELISIMEKLCKKEDISLIVMGTNGATGWKEAFLGSNAGDVIQEVPVLSLSIPADAKFEKIKKIGFTTCFKDKDKIALKQLSEFAKKIDAAIKCVYVKTDDAAEIDDTVKIWEKEFANDPITFFVLPGEEVETTILDFINEHNVAVLAMLTYKRGFFEGLFNHSLTKKIAFHTQIPILALHD